MPSIPFQPIIHKQVYIAAAGVHTNGVIDDRVTFGRHFIVDHYVFTVVTAVITCHSFDLYILEPRPSLPWINFALSVSASALYFNCRKTSVNCKPTIVPYDPRHSVSRRASKMVIFAARRIMHNATAWCSSVRRLSQVGNVSKWLNMLSVEVKPQGSPITLDFP